MKIIFSILLITILMAACVSSSKHNEVVQSRDSLIVVSDSLKEIINNKKNDIYGLEEKIQDLTETIANLQSQLFNTKQNLKSLREKASGDTQTLLKQMEDLQADKIELESTLAKKSRQLDEINEQLKARDAKMDSLKNKISEALLGFQDKGLSVDVKNGKVYVSLSNQLLFSSGSTVIDSKGKSALKDLSEVLNENTDINILVEGHTDDQSVRSGQRFRDNWDLSVLRATEVAKYLEKEGEVDPKRITASGKSQYYPVQEGSDDDSRAMNRRTEIILSPDLQMIYDVIDG